MAADIAREAEAKRARARLDSAEAVVDVARRMSGRVLDQGARPLRARPVESTPRANFEIELRVRRYGIDADSWDDQARFMIDAEVFLLDGESGRVIWKAKVDERERVSSGLLGWALPDALGSALTAGQLASLSTAEMKRALESLADYCADRMIEKLRRGLEKARG